MSNNNYWLNTPRIGSLVTHCRVNGNLTEGLRKAKQQMQSIEQQMQNIDFNNLTRLDVANDLTKLTSCPVSIRVSNRGQRVQVKIVDRPETFANNLDAVLVYFDRRGYREAAFAPRLPEYLVGCAIDFAESVEIGDVCGVTLDFRRDRPLHKRDII